MSIKKFWKYAVATCVVLCISTTGTAFAAENNESAFIEAMQQAMAEGTVYHVRQDGMGDYTSIQDAVNVAESGDTVLIFPGVYEEAVTIEDKTVNLMGTNRDSCVIQCDAAAYAKVPLAIAAGKVNNLTIYAEGSGEATNSGQDMNIADWESLMISDFSGYAVHVESNYSYGKELSFTNCRIISDSNYCIGMGCRGDFQVLFDGCELLGRGEAGSIYMHDAGDETFGGEAHVTFRDCTMKSYQCPYVLSMHSLHTTNRNYLTFQNVHVSAVAYEKKSIYNDYNLYQGYEVDKVSELEKQGLLTAVGYQKGMTGLLVKRLTIQDSLDYLQRSRKAAGSLDDDFSMSEGITYIKMTETDEASKAKEETGTVSQRKRSVINIWNRTGEEGEGWCGLNNTVLTADSFGNTLLEMNYSAMTSCELPPVPEGVTEAELEQQIDEQIEE